MKESDTPTMEPDPHPNMHNPEEHDLLMEQVVQDDPGLLYLDTFLHELNISGN